MQIIIRGLAFCLIVNLVSYHGYSQNSKDSVIHLDEVRIFGSSLSEFSAGTDIIQVKSSNSGSLSSINDQTTIYFKEYGNGQLATIALRGTSASQTNVLWNGLPVNSPTLGQTDFSVWPSFFSNTIAIQKGSASALFGSGSIGGSVIIDNSELVYDSLITTFLGLGSFGRRDIGLKIQSIENRFSLETKLYASEIANDFPFELNGEEFIQEHADVDTKGLSQIIKYKTKKRTLFTEGTYVRNKRNIQPSIGSASRDNLEIDNGRVVVSSDFLLGNNLLYSSIGATHDRTLYNVSIQTTSNQLVFNVSYKSHLTDKVSNQTGFSYISTSGKSLNYDGDINENQGHVFSSWNYHASKNLYFTLNLREAFHENNEVFVPALGASYFISADFEVKSQISKGYRYPTFNDRHWSPGGNLELLPEESWNYELGFDLVKNHLSFKTTLYHSEITNWIQWLPINAIWSPENIRQVSIVGFDTSLGIKSASIGKGALDALIQYEYNHSRDESQDKSTQLPYVPRHSVSSEITYTWNNSDFQFRGNFTGDRFTTLSNNTHNQVDGYLLLDYTFSQQFLFSGASWIGSASIKNILNTSYQNLENIAMPGRNFLIQLMFKI